MNGIDLTHEEFLAAVAKHGVEPWMLMGGFRGVDEIAGRTQIDITYELGYLNAYAQVKNVWDAFYLPGCTFHPVYHLLSAQPGPDGSRCGFYRDQLVHARDMLARFIANDVLSARRRKAERRKWRKAA